MIKFFFIPRHFSEVIIPYQQLFDTIDEEVIDYSDVNETICFMTLDNYFQQFITRDEKRLDDFEETKDMLSKVASSLKYCDNPKLNELGYRRINFTYHRYFMLYRIENDVVIIDNIFHELQDYENHLL